MSTSTDFDEKILISVLGYSKYGMRREWDREGGEIKGFKGLRRRSWLTSKQIFFKQIDGIGRVKYTFEAYPPFGCKNSELFFSPIRKEFFYTAEARDAYDWDGIVIVLQLNNFLEKSFFPLMQQLWSEDSAIYTRQLHSPGKYRDNTIILVFDPIDIYENPEYDTFAVMKKKLIPGIEKNIPSLKRISTPTPHIFFCLKHVVGVQTNILQHIMVFLSFDIVWTSDDEKDTRKIIFVNPHNENITNMGYPSLFFYTVVSRNFEYMKNLIISRTTSSLRKRMKKEGTLMKKTGCTIS